MASTNEQKLGLERIYIGVSCAGIGEKRARDYGLGFRRTEDGQIEVSIGRKGPRYYHASTLATAWVKLTPTQAHETACAIMHLTHNEFPCQGEGVQETGNHQANLRMNLDFTVDLCSILKDPKAIKAEILKKVTEKLEGIQLPSEKITSQDKS